jgi:hypothetical protein
MIDISKEAEEYAKTITNLPQWNKHDANIFIAGHNSKATEAKILQAQIDVLKSHVEHPTKPGYKRYDILDKIKKLEKELKQLKDE